MAVGKYSPTVSGWYSRNQQWFKEVPPEQNCGLVGYDAQGYDRYGYNTEDVDRAGHHEFEYLQSEEINGEYEYVLFGQVQDNWWTKPFPY